MTALEAALTSGRREHEALMVDSVRLYRQAPDAFDRSTGSAVPGQQTTLYAGKARVKPVAQSTGEDVQAGEREVILREYEVALPWSTVLPGGGRVLAGDRIEVQASPDVRLSGLTLWVTGTQFSATATAWRISAEDRS